MDACAALSQAVERAWADGLDKLSDGEMVGLMAAAHRNGARQAALKLAVTGKLAARRAAPTAPRASTSRTRSPRC
jgi:hypothetical protein